MIRYLFIKYFSYSFLVSISIFAFFASVSLFNISLTMFFQSFLIGGTLGIYFTYKYFAYLNYWVLFSNLRINRYKWLSTVYIIYLVILFLIIILLRSYIAGIWFDYFPIWYQSGIKGYIFIIARKLYNRIVRL